MSSGDIIKIFTKNEKELETFVLLESSAKILE